MNSRLNRFTCATCVVAAAVLTPMRTSAQSAVTQGDRIRVRMIDGMVLTGTVQSTNAELVRMYDPISGMSVAVQPSEIDHVSRSLGRHRNFGTNFLATVTISAFAFGAISGIAWSPCIVSEVRWCLLHPSSRGDAIVMGVLGGAALGVPIGLIVGAAVKSERWERALLGAPGTSAFTVRPVVGRSFGLRGSVAFGGR